jgi:SAM-dependent methyltransferase
MHIETDYTDVTELSGDDVTQEQIDRIYQRYYWAGEFCRDKDVLELACGTGQGLGYISTLAKSLIAGDISASMVAKARDHYVERIDLRLMDAQDTQLPDTSCDVVILFEAIYYIPDAEQFVRECARVLRPGGKVLIATANKDLYDFNPSPHTYKYYGVVELNELFARHGFESEFFGDMRVGDVSIRQRVLRPIKRLVVMLGIMPKSMAGKKILKKLVFGGLVEMPAEIGPQITQIDADLGAKKGPRITRIAPVPSAGVMGQARNEENTNVYRGRYVELDRIFSEEANTSHKVIYCAASLK